ncbi:bifunctional phosphopantothenoylcysteine decarboxylase/phosphopantothenate--cysteine ligase CoaBC [Glaciihabitans sp. INWT7]|uniref:bifunctional phosphopantothenoylcysteine decarboxylase/phosphopantothenate--cysteine ligase CoaBC n=1 Tax=Glaciihabitans sp. INWT7 TaxID=2596912 RepID=UPI0016265799|nr:bifunctional phosphopantothenoylcysteine decarboxylase/phosphopantothenate--cysteine ligase CoaBC [Glaciihabitans sp. INWT7]QNE46876.1 bifunctional phosphopantothenoylcysteine decarboxylase/phosphopantothenate--cysteine ligase CoaBC [Glaciihabitans sp. INWT7]
MNIVVGVTGGIAAYKAVNVIRGLVLLGHDVHVVATEAALRFVGKPTLEAISRNIVHTDLYEGVAEVRHVAIGQAAELIVIAPATANTIAKLASGLADDLLGNTVLASRAPVVIAPAMHTEMWQHPATVHNIAVLRSRGVTVVGPAVGQLTGADSGPGRLEEPDEIVRAALAVLEPKDLVGRRILVSAGGTREALDPVRYLGNRSSGKQGVALALAAAARGAEVTLVGANLEVDTPASMRVVHVGSTLELATAMQDAAPEADVVIMAAAVADYRPESVADAKIKKEIAGDRLTLQLVKNPDVLAGLAENRGAGQVIVGFAAETEQDRDALVALGRAKIARKGSDLLVLNRVGWTEGFGTDGNTVIVLDRLGDIVMEATGSKQTVADRILDAVVARFA